MAPFPAAPTPVIVALDTPEREAACALAWQLAQAGAAVKLGLEFFTAQGPDGVRAVIQTMRQAMAGAAAPGVPPRVFLDLKFHDIPNTVAGAVHAAAALGVWMLTVHTTGGPAMLRAAADAARAGTPAGQQPPLVVGVTVLTSMDDGDLHAVGVADAPLAQVQRLTRLAMAQGLDGVVCSPAEIGAVRAAGGPGCVIVTPGIRPAGSAADDQKRTLTPAEARQAGANYLVVGRPITRAADPLAACRTLVDSIER